MRTENEDEEEMKQEQWPRESQTDEKSEQEASDEGAATVRETWRTPTTTQTTTTTTPHPIPNTGTGGGGGGGGGATWRTPTPRPILNTTRATAGASAAEAGAFAPVPQPLQIPVIPGPWQFELPLKRITNAADLNRLQSSETGTLLLGFIAALNEAMKGRKLSDPCQESPLVRALLRLLDAQDAWIQEFPPAQHRARYGNPAFRHWQERLQSAAAPLLRELLESLPEPGPALAGSAAAADELAAYLRDSFGSAARIDYGTGHETNFVAFLLCLARLGLLARDDYQAAVARVFARYLALMRRLQTTYWLEPAGSHGVWGLDDYHFLPFVFGSAQLMEQTQLLPSCIHDTQVLASLESEYMYLGCVAFVKRVKRGPFSEHSPMMHDISAVASWAKVNSGMLKMYRADVLGKLPIMQHFLFGSILKWE